MLARLTGKTLYAAFLMGCFLGPNAKNKKGETLFFRVVDVR